MGYVLKREGFDHAGLTRMIEALSELVSCLPMLVESMSRRRAEKREFSFSRGQDLQHKKKKKKKEEATA